MTAFSTLWNKKQKSCIFFFYIVSEREERFPKLVSRKFPHKPKRHSQIKGHHITNPTNALCLVGNPSKLHLHCLIIDPHLMTTANSFGENKKHVSPFTDPIWVIFGAYFREYLRKQKINLTNTRHPCLSSPRWFNFSRWFSGNRCNNWKIGLAASTASRPRPLPTKNPIGSDWHIHRSMYDFWTEHVRFNVAKSTIHGPCMIPWSYGSWATGGFSFQKVSVSCKAFLVSTWLPSIKSGGGCPLDREQ